MAQLDSVKFNGSITMKTLVDAILAGKGLMRRVT